MYKGIADEATRLAYEELDRKLGAAGLPLRGLGYVMTFARIFNRLAPVGRAGHAARFSHITGGRDDMAIAREAWLEMSREGAWHRTHLCRVRRELSQLLGLVVPALRYAVDPAKAPDPQMGMVYMADRSSMRTFTMHDCLPLRMKGDAAPRGEREVLSRLVDEVTSGLHNVSRQHVYKIALFVDNVVFGRGVPQRGRITGADVADLSPSSVDACVVRLRRLTARDWLHRYQGLYAVGGVSFDQFKRHMRYLAILHGGGGSATRIPLPSVGGRVFCADPLEDLSSAATSASQAAEGAEDGGRAHRVDLRRLVARVQQACVRGTDGGEDPDRIYAFTPDEVRSIVGAAVSDEERLFVLLLLSTGLRLGGLCRLRLAEADRRTLGASGAPPYRASQMPVSFPTTEKNGKCRVVRLPNICRVLLARWFSHSRPASDTAFVFPSRVKAGEHVSLRYGWGVFDRLFKRVGMTGAHCNPHTFWHTVIRMLYARGHSFDRISKWIGHTDQKTTAAVYGRLSVDEIHAGISIPTEGGGTAGDIAAAWRDVGDFLLCPYVLPDSDWDGLLPNPRKRPRPVGDDTPVVAPDMRDMVRAILSEMQQQQQRG